MLEWLIANETWYETYDAGSYLGGYEEPVTEELAIAITTSNGDGVVIEGTPEELKSLFNNFIKAIDEGNPKHVGPD